MLSLKALKSLTLFNTQPPGEPIFSERSLLKLYSKSDATTFLVLSIPNKSLSWKKTSFLKKKSVR